MTEQAFAAGHVFFSPGDPGDLAYLVHDGQVELLAGAPEAFTRVALFGPGDVFGEMALIEERPRGLTARVVTACRVTPMARDDFEHQLTNDPARARQYLRSLFERLRSLTSRLTADDRNAHAAPSPPAAKPAHAELPTAGTTAGWTVVIQPITRKAAETLPDDGLAVTRFPLRIGRASAANEPEAFDLNDLWLLDDVPYNISRSHCEIDIGHEGPVVRDRGSHLGCIVNDERIGGRARAGHAPLDAGDNVLVIGSGASPYQFRVVVIFA
jgi:CRP-like cAMP-binding protein